MLRQFTAEDLARVIDNVEREFPIARILPDRLTTMVEYTRKNLAKEGGDQENPSKKVFDKAITDALKSHRGTILSNRKKLYRRAVEMLLEGELNQSTHKETGGISQQLHTDMYNTEQQRNGDPQD